MTILQHTDERLVVRAGVRILNETTLTLDRGHGVARLERATLMIPRRAEEHRIDDIRDVALVPAKDPASGAERYLPTLRLADGHVMMLPPFDDKAEAEHTVEEMRAFVGLKH